MTGFVRLPAESSDNNLMMLDIISSFFRGASKSFNHPRANLSISSTSLSLSLFLFSRGQYFLSRCSTQFDLFKDRIRRGSCLLFKRINACRGSFPIPLIAMDGVKVLLLSRCFCCCNMISTSRLTHYPAVDRFHCHRPSKRKAG